MGQLSDLTIPLFIGMVIDLLTKEKYNEIYTLCTYLLILVVVSHNLNNLFKIAAIAVGVRALAFSIMSEKIAKNIRKDFYESTINKDVAFYDERRTGDLSKYCRIITTK